MTRRVDFVSPTETAFLNAIAHAVDAGARRISIPVVTPLARAVAARAPAQCPGIEVELGSARSRGAEPAPVAVLCETDGARLGAALMDYIDRPDVTIIAAMTDWHWNRRPLFLISIPKAGTHLLTELVHAFGYSSGGEPDPRALPGYWHFLEFTNSHTAAPDFFVDSVRRAPYGNRAHPFAHHPSVFIYRNPLDIVASEANYYYEDGATTFSGYLDALPYEERLLRLIDDPWLLGSIRDRVGKFAAWLEFGSVIPVSYEELVGAQGGGSDAAQIDAIWSLMLRLQVPGRPEDVAARIFNANAETFRTGRIGGHERRFTPAAWEKFRALPQDFMQAFGYGGRPTEGPWLPSRAAEFRRRRPRYSRAELGNTAFVVRSNFLGKKIVRHRDRFWAITPGRDITTEELEAADRQGLCAPDLDTIQFLIQGKVFLKMLENERTNPPRHGADGPRLQPRQPPLVTPPKT